MLLLVLANNVCCGSFSWQCVVLGLLGGNVYCMSEVAMYVVVCFWWQCELLGVLSGNVYCWVF